jgi:hypothetical protein
MKLLGCRHKFFENEFSNSSMSKVIEEGGAYNGAFQKA